MSVIPIFIIIILIVIIGGFLFFQNRWNLGRKFGYFLLGGYTLFLVITFVVYLFIPVDAFLDEDFPEDGETKDMFHSVVYNGVPIKEFAEFEKASWDFNVAEGESIWLTTEYYDFPVIIERVDDQEELKVTLYEMLPDVEPVELFGDQGEDGVVLQSNNLTIYSREPYYYELGQFEKEFPFTRFTAERAEIYMHVLDILNFEKLYYIHLPEHVELLYSPDMYVEWLRN